MSESSLKSLFHPTSIAIIGASNKSNRIGYHVVQSLLRGKFPGPIYPINPRLQTLLGLPVFPTIEAVPGPVNLAIIVLRKNRVIDAVVACGRKEVSSIIVMSSGFSEAGDLALEEQLKHCVQKYEMRMLGPNCAGFASTWEHIYASFENRVHRGHLALISQSGAMCAVILALARSVGLGLSLFVSYGNAADVEPNEILQYLKTHKPTQLIGCYLEGITSARQFLAAAQEIAPHKPIVVLKPGETTAASRAIRAHTGALAGIQAVYSGAFRQAGILQASTLDELIDVCYLLDTQPLPRGRRIGIITNSGGPGVLAVDACARAKLDIAPFTSTLVRSIEELLPPVGPLTNPVDLGPEGTPESYRRVTELLLTNSHVDMVLVLCVPTAFSDIREISKSVIQAKSVNSQKPLVTSWLAGDIVQEGLALLAKAAIPNFPSPQRAADALNLIAQRAEWLRAR